LIFTHFFKKGKLKQTKSLSETTLKNFTLHLPLKNDEGKYDSVPLHPFFEAILTGKIALKDIIYDLQYNTAKLDNEKQNNETPQRDTPTRTPGLTASTPKFDRLTVTIQR
jgi:hypothetical protein